MAVAEWLPHIVFYFQFLYELPTALLNGCISFAQTISTHSTCLIVAFLSRMEPIFL